MNSWNSMSLKLLLNKDIPNPTDKLREIPIINGYGRKCPFSYSFLLCSVSRPDKHCSRRLLDPFQINSKTERQGCWATPRVNLGLVANRKIKSNYGQMSWNGWIYGIRTEIHYYYEFKMLHAAVQSWFCDPQWLMMMRRWSTKQGPNDVTCSAVSDRNLTNFFRILKKSMAKNTIFTSQLVPLECPIRRTCRIPISRHPHRRHCCQISRPCAANQPGRHRWRARNVI